MRRGTYLLAAALILLTLPLGSCAPMYLGPGEAPMEAEPTSAPEEPTEPEPTAAPEEPEATSTAVLVLPTPSAAPVLPTPSPPPLVEERNAELEWPTSMRVGDGEVIRLTLAPGPGGAAVATPEIAGHQVESTAIPLPVTRTGYDGYIRASLTAAGLDVAAAGPSEQPLQPGGANTWYWTISAARPGTYRPVVNLWVRWEPRPGSSARDSVEEAVWSRVLTVEARGLLGLSGPQVDRLGLGGSILGTVAGLPFLERALAALWGRLRRQRSGGSAP